jgi:hypothetical protein
VWEEDTAIGTGAEGRVCALGVFVCCVEGGHKDGVGGQSSRHICLLPPALHEWMRPSCKPLKNMQQCELPSHLLPQPHFLPVPTNHPCLYSHLANSAASTSSACCSIPGRQEVERCLLLLRLRLLLGLRGRLLRCCCCLLLPVVLPLLRLLLLLRDRLSRRNCCLLLGWRPLLLLMLLPLLLLRERLLRGCCCCCCRFPLSHPLLLLLLLLRPRPLLRLRERLLRWEGSCRRPLLLLLLLLRLRERLLRWCDLWREASLSLSLSLAEESLRLLLLLLRVRERFPRSAWLRPLPPALRVSLLLRPLTPSLLVLRRRPLSALLLRLL